MTKLKEWCDRTDKKMEKFMRFMERVDKAVTKFAIRLWTEVGKEILFMAIIYGSAELLAWKFGMSKSLAIKVLQILAFVLPTGFYIWKKIRK